MIANTLENRSIKLYFNFLLFVLSAFILIFGIVMYISKTRQERDFHKFTNTLESLSVLALNVGDMGRDLELYFKKGQEEYLHQYLEKRYSIRLKLAQLEEEFARSDYFLYIRIVGNLFDFSEQKLNTCLEFQEENPDIYDEQQQLFRSLSRMENYLTQWISHYISIEETALRSSIREQKFIFNTIFICLLIILLSAYIISFKTARIISGQLDAMVAHAKQLTAASWNIGDLPENNIKELNVLSQSMNVMKKSLNRYFSELLTKSDIEIKYRKEKQNNAEKNKLLFQVRYQLLARRLDPHFLFNSLNIVYRKCMFLGQEDITEVIASLANVLRYNLEIDTEQVLLSQELEVLESYLYIHKIRFDDKISILREINCNPEEIYIAPFVLQPLIEGIFAERRQDPTTGGILRIEISLSEKDEINFAISLESAMILTNGSRQSTSRIRPNDLSTLKERLDLVYQKKAQLKEEENPDSYRVKLSIPNCRDLEDVG